MSVEGNEVGWTSGTEGGEDGGRAVMEQKTKQGRKGETDKRGNEEGSGHSKVDAPQPLVRALLQKNPPPHRTDTVHRSVGVLSPPISHSSLSLTGLASQNRQSDFPPHQDFLAGLQSQTFTLQ